jgi:hypothetical protein
VASAALPLTAALRRRAAALPPRLQPLASLRCSCRQQLGEHRTARGRDSLERQRDERADDEDEEDARKLRQRQD